MPKFKNIFYLLLTLIFWLSLGINLKAADITVNAAIDGVTPTGSGTSGAPYVYDFGSTDMDLNADNVISNDFANFINILDLIITTGGDFDFSGTGNRDDLVVTGSGNLAFKNIKTNCTDGNDGGDITITSSGANINISESVDAYGNQSNGDFGGDITLTAHSGNITIGGNIDSQGQDNQNTDIVITAQSVTVGGNIDLHSDNEKAGHLTISANAGSIIVGGEIDTHGDPNNNDGLGGDITLTAHSGNITIGGNIDSQAQNNQNADIVITAQSVTVGGAIDLHSDSEKAGQLTISANAGSIIVGGDIDTHGDRENNDGLGGSISLTATSGNVSVSGNVDQSGYDNGASNSRSINISGDEVFVDGHVDTYSTNQKGGDVVITANTGGITIGGNVDAYGKLSDNQYGGNVTLTAQSGQVSIGGGIKNYGHKQDNNEYSPVLINAGSVSITDSIENYSSNDKGGDIYITASTGAITIGGNIFSYGGQGSNDEGGYISLIAATSAGLTISGYVNSSSQSGNDRGEIILSGGDVTVSGGGIDSHSDNSKGAAITISANTGSIDINGDIDSSGRKTNGSDYGGNIDLTAHSGNVTVAGNIKLEGGNNETHTLTVNAGNVFIGGGISSYCQTNKSGGDLSISANTGSITVGASIETQVGTMHGSHHAGVVNLIAHAGNVSVGGNINAIGGENQNCHVTISSGIVTVDGYIHTYSGSKDGAAVTISANVGAVTVNGNILTYSTANDDGGDISITDGAGGKVLEDVTVTGTLNADGQGGKEGDLEIRSSGNIQLGSADITDFKTVTLLSDARVIFTGALTNVAITGSNVDDTNFDSISSHIYYQSRDSSNSYLNYGTYNIYITGADSGYDLIPLPTGSIFEVY